MKKIDFMLMLSCVSSLAMFTTVAAQSINNDIGSQSTATQSESGTTVATGGSGDSGPASGGAVAADVPLTSPPVAPPEMSGAQADNPVVPASVTSPLMPEPGAALDVALTRPAEETKTVVSNEPATVTQTADAQPVSVNLDGSANSTPVAPIASQGRVDLAANAPEPSTAAAPAGPTPVAEAQAQPGPKGSSSAAIVKAIAGALIKSGSASPATSAALRDPTSNSGGDVAKPASQASALSSIANALLNGKANPQGSNDAATKPKKASKARSLFGAVMDALKQATPPAEPAQSEPKP